ncbi:MAG: glycine cleavage system aminomethyltransferase GcvT [Burkholderiaceae bacterium]|nr:glycine cleavage system aminomethyltransferase GcvT [Burkholderiaceae bacterium]
MNQPAQETLRRIPLHALHAGYGAKFGAFAGYEMPIQYPAGLKAEHLHTRERASLFDVSHMGQLRIRADDGRPQTLYAQLEVALPVDFDDWPHAAQRYSLLLNERGGIDDDLMLAHLVDGARAEVRMVVNAGNRDADLATLRSRCPQLRIEWVDAALVALQGPAAEAALAALDPAAASLRFMQAATLRLLGADCFATRSGYTGEDGYEISLPLAQAEAIVRRLLADPAVRLAGLGARDTLRLEAGLPLHGSDIDATTTPVESGLSFAIPKSRRSGGAKAGGFPGAATILGQLAAGTPRRLAGLVSREPVPIRAHAAIVTPDERVVGEVTSGTISPTLGHPVMLARIERSALDGAAQTPLRAVVRDRRPGVTPAPLPFVPKRYKR